MVPGLVLAQSQKVAAAVPANAHAKSFGSGWECKQGFRESDGACNAVLCPRLDQIATLK